MGSVAESTLLNDVYSASSRSFSEERVTGLFEPIGSRRPIVEVHRAAGNDGGSDGSLELPACKRRVPSLRPEAGWIDGHREIGSEHRDVGGGAFRKCPARHVEDLRRVRRQQLDQSAQCDHPWMHESIEADRNARLETNDSERRCIELNLL